ncbi:hypothetical protein BV25DRAFT_1361455 [Artomyces pyxidatus]|uniref:Uncharacterized protein n=1 Tax=Artomyces pyxidatus TaxID=48021 RepID=A0ACB8SMS0_9AGAM|nr:hypothetical protein BV25DRAFT_1361455 [Artomyces pyxidatus]
MLQTISTHECQGRAAAIVKARRSEGRRVDACSVDAVLESDIFARHRGLSNLTSSFPPPPLSSSHCTMATAAHNDSPQDPSPRGWVEEELHRRRLSFNKHWALLTEQRKPQVTLPSKYQMTRDNPDPPILAYGIFRTRDQLFDYAKKHDLRAPHAPDAPMDPKYCIPPCLERLRVQTDEPYLSIIPIWSPTEDDWHVVTLYTNHTMHLLRCIDADEQDILRILREELGTDGPPMWYWDECNEW